MNPNPLYENAILLAPISEEGFFDAYRKEHPKTKFDVLTIEEVEAMFRYSYDEDAVGYLVEKGYSYPFAKELLVGLCQMKEGKEYRSEKIVSLVSLFQEMVAKGLLYQDAYPFEFFKGRNIVIRGYSDGKRIASALEPLPNISLSWDKVVPPREDPIPYFAFDDIHQELHYLCNSIAKLLQKGVNPSDIWIVGLPSDAFMEMALWCEAYQLPFAKESVSCLYDLPFAKKAIEAIKEGGVDSLLASYDGVLLNQDERNVLSLISYYGHLGLEGDCLYSVLEDVLLDKGVSKKRGEGIVLTNGRNIPRGCHAFLVDFSFGKTPRLHRDASYFGDAEREELSLPTSLLLNQREEKELSALLSRPEVEYVSYSASRYGTLLYPSPYADRLSKQTPDYSDELSPEAASYFAASLNDDYERVRKENPYRASLNGQIPLVPRYDPQFVSFPEAGKKGTLYLSYSSLDQFYKCPFSYYLRHKMHLRDDETSFYARLGTLLHRYLEDFDGRPFDYGKAFDDIVEKEDRNGPPFTSKERFLLKNIKPIFMETLSFLEAHFKDIQNPEYHHELKVDLPFAKDVRLKGSIDLAIESGEEPRYVTILDFKTKGKTFDENVTRFGLNLQLPIYAYFASLEDQLKDDELLGVYFVPLVPSENKTNRLSGRHENIDGYKTFNPEPNGDFVEPKSGVNVENPGDYGKHLRDIAEKKLNEAIARIRNGDYPISPITLDSKDRSCTYCPFGDICFQRDEFRRYETAKENEDEADA